MSITEDTWRHTEQLRADVAKVTDAQARDLVSAWARAWDEVAGDLDDAMQDLASAAGDGRITRAMIDRSSRLTKALAVIGDKLTELSDDAEVRLTGDLSDIVATAGKTQAAIIGSQLPVAAKGLVVAWDKIDPNAIDAIITRSTEQIHKLTLTLAPEAEAAMKRELVRGLASGRNPRDVARRIVKRSEVAFDGGLNRALTIARTEMLDATREGARVTHQANSDLLRGWMWTAELGHRTCPACWGMNGTEHDLDEPGPEGHQNCRCARTPLTKSWQDLGIDMDEPAPIARDSGAAFDALDPADQVAILGRGRYDAWVRGDMPMSNWAVKQSNDGWRDSWVPAKAPAA